MRQIEWRETAPDGTKTFHKIEIPEEACLWLSKDDDGKDVYETDILVDDMGEEYRAMLAPAALGRHDRYFLDGQIRYFKRFKLKGDSNDR